MIKRKNCHAPIQQKQQKQQQKQKQEETQMKTLF